MKETAASFWAKAEIDFDKLDDMPKKPYTPEDIMAALKILNKMVHLQAHAYGGKESKLLPVGIAEGSLLKQVSLISEAFTSKFNPISLRANNSTYKAVAHIGDRDIIFRGAEELPGEWGVVFSEKRPKTGETFRITGSGNQMQVMAFAISSIKDIVARYAPSKINFTAEEEEDSEKKSRAKLYTTMVNKLELPGYKAKITQHEKSVEFDLIRQNEQS
jgi:hypothetical protein